MTSSTDRASLIERLFRALDFLEERERLVRINSWMPYWDGRYLCWPSYTADRPGQRAQISPCWDRARLKLLFRKLIDTIRARASAQ